MPHPHHRNAGNPATDNASQTADGAATQPRPPYTDEGWFWHALHECGSLAAMERRYGYSNQTLSRWARHHGILCKPRVTPAQRALVHAALDQGLSVRAAAERAGVSPSTVVRIARLRAQERA